MARRTTSRRMARPARSTRVTRVAARRPVRSRRSAGARRVSPARAVTVRVVMQAAPAPVAQPGAVSMTTLKKARF